MKIILADKLLDEYRTGEYLTPSSEAEAVAMAAGHWLATGKKADVYISADGFMNTLNFLTSWIIPDNIGMNIFISIGRMEKSHFIATELTEDLLTILKTYDADAIHYELIRKK